MRRAGALRQGGAVSLRRGREGRASRATSGSLALVAEWGDMAVRDSSLVGERFQLQFGFLFLICLEFIPGVGYGWRLVPIWYLTVPV